MTAPTVTQGPTTANPDRLETVEELRAELHRANAVVLRLSMHVQDMNAVIGGMGACLTKVLTAHLAGDAEKTIAALDELVAKHVVQAPAQPGGMH